MEQEPSDFLEDALLPLMKGLIAEALFKHSIEDVRVTVASCLSEILRITSPEQPYNDDLMKAIFQLIVEALSKLSQPSTRCYEKALSAIQTIAKVKACLLMLDLECEALVVQMCQQFWFITRLNPADDVVLAIEQIMMDILGESEDISSGLLSPLLASVLKENKNVAPSCWKLGERVITRCAAKLAPVLRGAVQSNGTTVDDYSPVVASICENEPKTMENNHANGSSQPVVARGVICSPREVVADLDSAPGSNTNSKGSTQLEIDLEAVPNKREQKPNKLMNLDEGLERQKSGYRKVLVNGHDLPAAPKITSRKRRVQQKVNVEPRTVARDKEALVPCDLAGKKLKFSMVGGRMSNSKNAVSEGSGLPGRRLVGQKIKVWWPLDEMFYSGVVQSYDPFRKRHKVLYNDGDIETLNLEKERWELIKDDLPAEHRRETYRPKPYPSPVVLGYKMGSSKKPESPRKLSIKQNVERTKASSRFTEVEVSQFGNQNVGRDESSDNESTEDNAYEIRFRSKDVQLEFPSSSTSDDSTPDASPPNYTKANPQDARQQSTSDDSTPEASPPRPWGQWRSRFQHH